MLSVEPDLFFQYSGIHISIFTSQELNDSKSFFMVISIMCLLGMLVCIVRASVLSKIFISVYKDSVSGVVGIASLFSTIVFDVRYDEIVRVHKKGAKVIIDCGTHRYVGIVEKADDVVALILNMKNHTHQSQPEITV